MTEVREALAEEMDGRGLWVFMEDGAPVDPEEEENILASTLNENADEEEGVDLLDGYSDSEVRQQLVR